MTTDSGTGPYLVERRDGGYGDVLPLLAGQRYTLGRANTNRIILKDELASRDHAEVYFLEDRWQLRDLKSLNGTRINGDVLDSEWSLAPGDEFQVGKTRFIFVAQIEDLPHIPIPDTQNSLTIKRRLANSRFLTPAVDEICGDSITGKMAVSAGRGSIGRDLMLLYHLSLAMGSARTYFELADVVIDGLLNAVSADVGAILTIKDGREMEITSVRPDGPLKLAYSPASEFVTHEVMSSREAILAEGIARNRYLSNRDSLTQLGATSLICAPVINHDRVLALVHLYCTDPQKSFSYEDLEFTIAVAKHFGLVMGQMLRQDSLSAENRSLREQLHVESELIGHSPAIKNILEQIGRVAVTNATVLIRGESGSGKELVARAIHFSSPRKEGPFICLNCAAIAETLLESELFGHERGAFTGATEKKIGKFEAADHGTVFLDEIGDMVLSTQAKLLRLLEGHPFERVGGSTPIRVDVRLVAATNQPLEQFISEGKFRRDLWYRLQVIEIQVPPLRERRSDMAMLAEHFLKRFVRETGRKIRGFTSPAIKKMEEHIWPGNVRELRNVVERAVALGTGPYIDANDISISPFTGSIAQSFPQKASGLDGGMIEKKIQEHNLDKTVSADVNTLPLGLNIRDIEKLRSDETVLAAALAPNLSKDLAITKLKSFHEALGKSQWKIGKAAELLGMNRQTLPRTVKQIFEEYPELESEYKDLSAIVATKREKKSP